MKNALKDKRSEKKEEWETVALGKLSKDEIMILGIDGIKIHTKEGIKSVNIETIETKISKLIEYVAEWFLFWAQADFDREMVEEKMLDKWKELNE